jgi:ATP-dependent helicase/DNAse subunit B
MIQLLIGPYRSGKTGRLLKELVEHKREYPLDSCLILVPSARYGNLLREQLVSLLDGSAGIFAVRIATVYDACEQVVRNSGVAPIVLPRELCADVVSDAVSRLGAAGKLSHLQSIAGMRGTCAALYGLIDEFERAALTPSEVLRAVDTTSSASSRHHELALIYKEYWNRLDELNVTDQKRLAFSCREILAGSSNTQSGWGAGSNSMRVLMIDGFDRISPLQAEVMHALSQHAAITKISFDYIRREDRGALSDGITEDEYSWKDSSFNELQERFQVPPQVATLPGPSSPDADGAAVRRPVTIEGFRAIERFFESQEIARRCKQILLYSKAKADNILVVARNIDDYSEAIRAAFNDLGIPFFIDESIEHHSLALTKFLLGMFRLVLNDFPRRQVIDCLRSPFFNLPGVGLTKANVESLDRKSLEWGILAGRAQWQKFLDQKYNEEMAIKFDAFFDLLTPAEQSNIADYCRWMEDMIEMLRKAAVARSADDPSSTASSSELEALAGLRAALNKLLLKDHVFPGQQVAYAEFFAQLESILEKSSLRRQPATHEAVYVCSAEHAPNRRFDCVFIAGAQEGNFPKHSGESGFLSPEERGRWASYGVKMINPREEPGFERALFKSLIDRARNHVNISAPCVDMSGDDIFPSFYLSDGTVPMQGFPRIDVSRTALMNPASAREGIGSWLWHQPGIEIGESLQCHDSVDILWSSISRSLIGSWSRHQGGSSTAYNGYLVDLTESGWLKIKTPTVLSASALNDYGQCPFKFWLSRLLSVAPRVEAQPGLTVQFKGSLFHKALENYYSAMVQIHPDLRLEKRQQVLQESLSSAVTELERQSQFHPSPFWANEQKELLFRLNRFVEYDEARMARDKEAPQAALFEARFGMPRGNSYPGLSIQTSAGPINVRGVIDRIDINSNVESGDDAGSATAKMSVTVIDYKTGSTPITSDDIGAFAQVQLPLYAMAVQQSILPRAKVSAGHYLSVNAAKSIGSVQFQNERWSDLIANARERVKQSLESMGQGDFSVRPYASKACNNCDHAAVCRIGDMKQSQSVEGV